jgi:hypothetical protein
MTDYHAGQGDLMNALSNLKKGDRVFITFDDYAQYNSPGGVEPHDIDDVGRLALVQLAMALGTVLKIENAERRIYFTK